jgi:NADH-quinone oxidoreductase subunit D
VRQFLETVPGALLPDPVEESESPGVALSPPDDDDLLRPRGEEDLWRVATRGSLAGVAPTALAKHLVWTFGPIHRALPFPMQLRMELDGDRLVTVDPEVGFLHQGLEKAAEQIAWEDLWAVVARAYPLRPLAHELALALAWERLCGIEDAVPRAVQLWRVVGLELLRAAEHLRVLTHPALQLVPRTARRTRGVVDAARAAAGLVDAIAAGGTFRRAGGLRRALDADEASRIRTELPRIASPVAAIVDRLEADESIDVHLAGRGHLDRSTALAYAVTGPALRACGVADDLRRHDPAFGYAELTVPCVLQDGGGARARTRVRWHETLRAVELVQRALATLEGLRGSEAALEPPTGVSEKTARPPPGRQSGAIEAPNGELAVTLVSDGGPRPMRVRIRSPSLALLAALPRALTADRIDDVVPVLASLDILGTELDR